MKRVALYVRVSTEEQKQHGLSIEAQMMALKEWAERNKHFVVGIYNDAGISARKPASKRPELQRLLSDIEQDSIDLVAFTKLDRWFRNIAEYYKVQEILDKHNVNWQAIHEDYETVTASGKLKVNIMLAVAQDEADRTSERIKAVASMKRAKGLVVQSKPPFGYKIVDSHLEIDEEKEAAVRFFFRRYAETSQLMHTADAVRELYGYNLTYRIMYNMLDSKTYCGEHESGDCPAYITKEEYAKLQLSRKQQARSNKYSTVPIFGGLINCAECGAKFKYRVAKPRCNGKEYEYIYYTCAGRERRSGCLNYTRYREEAIEERLLELLPIYLSQIDVDAEQAKADNPKPKIAAIKKRMAKLKELYLDDIISKEDFNKQFAECKEKLWNLELSTTQTSAGQKAKTTLKKGWYEEYKALPKDAKRVFWKSMVKDVTINSNGDIDFVLL